MAGMRAFMATLLLGATLALPSLAQNAAQPQEFRVVNR